MVLNFESSFASTAGRLAATWAQGDEDQIVYELKGLHARNLSMEQKSLSTILVRILQETKSSRIRNAAALASSDLGIQSNAKIMIDVLRRKEVEKSSGTMLFALNELQASMPLDLLVEIVEHRAFEARSEAMHFLEDGRFDGLEVYSFGEAIERFAVLMQSDDQELAEAADYARACLLDYAAARSAS